MPENRHAGPLGYGGPAKSFWRDIRDNGDQEHQGDQDDQEGELRNLVVERGERLLSSGGDYVRDRPQASDLRTVCYPDAVGDALAAPLGKSQGIRYFG